MAVYLSGAVTYPVRPRSLFFSFFYTSKPIRPPAQALLPHPEIDQRFCFHSAQANTHTRTSAPHSSKSESWLKEGHVTESDNRTVVPLHLELSFPRFHPVPSRHSCFSPPPVALYIKGNDVTKLASMAKLKAGRLARELSDSCLQFWGGMGFTSDVMVSRFYR